MNELAITAVNAITAVGHDGALTAAAARAGLCGYRLYDRYRDQNDNPITAAPIRGIEDDLCGSNRLTALAHRCLEPLLAVPVLATPRPSLRVLLTAASPHRPGPDHATVLREPLVRALKKVARHIEVVSVPRGNGAFHHALEQAANRIAEAPETLCLIGGIDSLLSRATLNGLEANRRLKSGSMGRHHGLVAGEAAAFVQVEHPDFARRAGLPVLARVSGLGLAEEPTPRARGEIRQNQGLRQAIRMALDSAQTEGIATVFGDLNGENTRALEWHLAAQGCFNPETRPRQLRHPADAYGDVGAVSGAVLATIAAHGLTRNWVHDPALLFCTDDFGACGALVLQKG